MRFGPLGQYRILDQIHRQLIPLSKLQPPTDALAGDVSLSAGNLAGQAFQAGLIDEVRIDLVPVVLGAGVRYFGNYTESPLLLEDPEVVQGDRVTHLR